MPLFADTLEPLPPLLLAGLAMVGLLGAIGLQKSRAPDGLIGAVRAGLRFVAILLVVYVCIGTSLTLLRLVAPELTIHLRPVWPWPMVLVMSLTSVGVVLGTYPQRLATLPSWPRAMLLTMRLAAAVMLLIAMLRPELQWSKKNDSVALFPVLSDVSRSMATKDGPANISRFEAQEKLLTENRSLLEQLRKKLQIPEYQYSKELVSVGIGQGPGVIPPTPASGTQTQELTGPSENSQTPQTPPSQFSGPQGEQTAIGYTLESLLKQTSSQPTIGILLMGDFAQRAVAPYDLDPRIVAQRFSETHIPIYTVPFGASTLTNSGRDLIAEDLVISPTVFVKNTVIVSAKVRALGAAGREQSVQLLVEQPTNRLPGQPPQMEVRKSLKIKPRGNEDVIPVELDFIPQQAGEFRVTIKVLPDDGETVLANNELTTFITVLKGGLSIAYFDVARNEVVPIQNMAKSPDIQLDLKLVRFGQRFGEFSLEDEWFQPGKYDVYIIGDVPAEVFNQSKMKKPPLLAIHEAVERGAGLLMLGGVRNYGAGGYADTPLAVTLPIILNPSDKQSGMAINPALHLTGGQPMVPTPEGLNHFIMRVDSLTKNEARWKELPPLNGAVKFGRLKPLAQRLARTPDGKPLLVASDIGRGRAIAFAGDTTFRWALAGHEDVSQRFWRQMILWLAHKELQGDSTVWLKLNERRFRPNQPVDLTFGAKDAEGVPIADAQFKATVFDPKGIPKPLASQVLAQDHTARFQETLTPGEYTAEVEASKGGQVLGVTRARFMVYEHDLELNNPAADTAFAAELAQLTGGQMVPPEELSSFLKSLLKKEFQFEDKKLTTFRLWDHWLFLILFVSIMTIEWFVRKSRGMV